MHSQTRTHNIYVMVAPALLLEELIQNHQLAASMANQTNNDEEFLSSTLPKDAMSQILIRVPVKSLVKFRSVCKSWYTFLKSPDFVKLHLTYQISRPVSNLIVQNRANSAFVDLALLHLHNNHSGFLKLPLPFTVETKNSANFRFCYNGLIFLETGRFTSPSITLWNPATRYYKSVEIPSECTKYTYLQIGYLEERNDYKLLKVPFEPRSHIFDEDSNNLVWIYTASLGSWKTVPFILLDLTVQWGPPISMNGFMYWTVTPGVQCIIRFDLINDEFTLLDVPDDRGRTNVNRRLMVLRGSLAMMVSLEDGSLDTEIWVMKTSCIKGVQHHSWTKKLIFEPFAKSVTPLGIWDADKLLVKVNWLKEVYTYDLVTKRIEYFNVPKEQEFASYDSLAGRYFESLVEL